MSKSNAFETALLELIFNGVDITGLATDGGNANLYLSLHTADPGEAGTQATNEVAYTSYARAAVARDGSGWTVTGNSVSPDAAIGFPECTGGTATATHAGIGTLASGAGVLLYKGALNSPLAISTGVAPSLTTAVAVTED